MELKRPIELLVPASSLEVLKIAVIYGADAVYIGGEASDDQLSEALADVVPVCGAGVPLPSVQHEILYPGIGLGHVHAHFQCSVVVAGHGLDESVFRTKTALIRLKNGRIYIFIVIFYRKTNIDDHLYFIISW